MDQDDFNEAQLTQNIEVPILNLKVNKIIELLTNSNDETSFQCITKCLVK